MGGKAETMQSRLAHTPPDPKVKRYGAHRKYQPSDFDAQAALAYVKNLSIEQRGTHGNMLPGISVDVGLKFIRFDPMKCAEWVERICDQAGIHCVVVPPKMVQMERARLVDETRMRMRQEREEKRAERMPEPGFDMTRRICVGVKSLVAFSARNNPFLQDMLEEPCPAMPLDPFCIPSPPPERYTGPPRATRRA